LTADPWVESCATTYPRRYLKFRCWLCLTLPKIMKIWPQHTENKVPTLRNSWIIQWRGLTIVGNIVYFSDARN
jgi:hypothetical protein